jgi:hypothetical protein
MLSGHYVTSLPGGLCASNEEVAEALLEQAKKLVRAEGAKYLLLRDDRKKWELPELVIDEDHVTFLIELGPGLDQVQKTFRKRTRQLVNQALRGDLQAMTGIQMLDRFYPTFSKAMRDKGTPTLGLDFFRTAVAHLPGQMSLIMLCFEEQVVGGGFMAPFKDTIHCNWSGMLREFYPLRPSHLLVWEAIRYGFENGFRWVDLGRTRKNSGGYTFKKAWGGEVQQLYQHSYLNGVTEPPAVGGSLEEHARYRVFVSMWQKLPLPVAELLGPELRKRMPFG